MRLVGGDVAESVGEAGPAGVVGARLPRLYWRAAHAVCGRHQRTLTSQQAIRRPVV